jgi:hypothetical protein
MLGQEHGQKATIGSSRTTLAEEAVRTVLKFFYDGKLDECVVLLRHDQRYVQSKPLGRRGDAPRWKEYRGLLDDAVRASGAWYAAPGQMTRTSWAAAMTRLHRWVEGLPGPVH